MNKQQIIEKFKNAIQKVGLYMQQILTDETINALNKLDAQVKKNERYFTEVALRRREVNNTIPEEVHDEISSRVNSTIINGYSELSEFVLNESPTTNDFEQLKLSLKETTKNLRQIPDEVDGMFKDKKLNFKNLRTCVGLETVDLNEQNANATMELLSKIDSSQKQQEKLSKVQRI